MIRRSWLYKADQAVPMQILCLIGFFGIFFFLLVEHWTLKQFMLRHFCFPTRCWFRCGFIDCCWLLRQMNRTITSLRLKCACCIWRARNFWAENCVNFLLFSTFLTRIDWIISVSSDETRRKMKCSSCLPRAPCFWKLGRPLHHLLVFSPPPVSQHSMQLMQLCRTDYGAINWIIVTWIITINISWANHRWRRFSLAFDAHKSDILETMT